MAHDGRAGPPGAWAGDRQRLPPLAGAAEATAVPRGLPSGTRSSRAVRGRGGQAGVTEKP